jgi:hypothetical protein
MTDLIVKLRSVLRDGADSDDLLDTLFPDRRKEAGVGDVVVPDRRADPFGVEFAPFEPDEITTTLDAVGTMVTHAETIVAFVGGVGAHTLSVERQAMPDGSLVFRRQEAYGDAAHLRYDARRHQPEPVVTDGLGRRRRQSLRDRRHTALRRCRHVDADPLRAGRQRRRRRARTDGRRCQPHHVPARHRLRGARGSTTDVGQNVRFSRIRAAFPVRPRR